MPHWNVRLGEVSNVTDAAHTGDKLPKPGDKITLDGGGTAIVTKITGEGDDLVIHAVRDA